MDWQEVTALAIVAATVAIFVWRAFRPKKLPWEKDSHCGCSTKHSSVRGPSITVSGRRGERPTITVKSG